MKLIIYGMPEGRLRKSVMIAVDSIVNDMLKFPHGNPGDPDGRMGCKVEISPGHCFLYAASIFTRLSKKDGERIKVTITIYVEERFDDAGNETMLKVREIERMERIQPGSSPAGRPQSEV